MAIYLVEGPNGTKRLVDTRTKSAAIQHVASKEYTAKPLGVADAFAYANKGFYF